MRTRRSFAIVAVIGVVAGLSGAAAGQSTGGARPAFDAAVIMPNTSGDPIGASGFAFVQAFHEQDGLKLDPQMGPVDVIVVDHIERPTSD